MIGQEYKYWDVGEKQPITLTEWGLMMLVGVK